MTICTSMSKPIWPSTHARIACVLYEKSTKALHVNNAKRIAGSIMMFKLLFLKYVKYW